MISPCGEAGEEFGGGGGAGDPFFEFFLPRAFHDEAVEFLVFEVFVCHRANRAPLLDGEALLRCQNFCVAASCAHLAKDKLAGLLVAPDGLRCIGLANPAGDIIGVAPGFLGGGLHGGRGAGEEFAGVVYDFRGHAAERLQELACACGGIFQETGDFPFGFEAGFEFFCLEILVAGRDVGRIVVNGGDYFLIQIIR